MSAFDKALALVLRHEGGLVSDERDPGGLTNCGISQRAYPDLDIRNLKVADIALIYRTDYWDAIKGDQLPDGLAICVFDAAVNMGTDKAIRLLQKACSVQVDGMLGPNTLRAANRLPDAVARFSADRAIAYTGIRNFDLYGKGWLRRTIATAMEAAT
jgi:lysozyme family protein